MSDYPAKKKWQTPSIELISSNRSINGGGPHSSAEVSANGTGIYIITIGGINAQVGQSSYTQAHS